MMLMMVVTGVLVIAMPYVMVGGFIGKTVMLCSAVRAVLLEELGSRSREGSRGASESACAYPEYGDVG